MRKSQINFGGKFEFRSYYNCTTKVTKSTRITVLHKNNPNFMSSQTFTFIIIIFYDNFFFEFPILNSDLHEFYNQLSNCSDKTNNNHTRLNCGDWLKICQKFKKACGEQLLKKSLVFYFFPIVTFWTFRVQVTFKFWERNFEIPQSPDSIYYLLSDNQHHESLGVGLKTKKEKFSYQNLILPHRLAYSRHFSWHGLVNLQVWGNSFKIGWDWKLNFFSNLVMWKILPKI